ncbi:MAG: hypothetical protein OEY85_00005, partial [Rhodospirillales bacterium]|nr:hypothetical protein [Rhodospirillales bacterium]
ETEEESGLRVVEDRIEISDAARQALALSEALNAGKHHGQSGLPTATLQEIRADFEEKAAQLAKELGNKFRQAGIDDAEQIVLNAGEGEFTISGDHPALGRIEALLAADPAFTERFVTLSQVGSLLATADTHGDFASAYGENAVAAVDTYATQISNIDSGIHFLYQDGGMTALLGLPGGSVTWWSTVEVEGES